MKFLLTGGAGYIGSVATRKFLEEGHEVKVLDRFFFGEESLEDVKSDKNLELIRDDIRWFNPEILDDVDVVIDYAALSNDPAGELDPSKTYDINYLGRVRVAKLSKQYGVDRYILPSTCSVYGSLGGEKMTEEDETDPLTAYAKANLKCEKEVLPLADEDFCVTVIRQATVYGASHRMRFDLAINGMVGAIYENGELGVMRDGTQWRPFVHVEDTSRAQLMIAEADRELVNGERFNVGSNEQNYQIKPLAEEIMGAFDFEVDWSWYGDPDERTYSADFSKIHNTLDFETEHTPKEAAKNIYNAMEKGELEKTEKTITVNWYKNLLKAKETVDNVGLRDTII